MRVPVLVLAAVFAGCAATAAVAQPAPSFDCAKAGSAVEKTICEHGLLSWLDSQMGELYTAARAELSEADRTELRDHQRAWIKERNRCGANYDCLAKSYGGRLRTVAALWEGSDTAGVFEFVDFGFSGAMGLAPYPDGRVAAFIETVNDSRGHSCTLDFVGQLGDEGEVVWQDLEDQYGDGTFCKVTIALAPNQARVFPDNCRAYCGMAGSFEGNYRRP